MTVLRPKCRDLESMKKPNCPADDLGSFQSFEHGLCSARFEVNLSFIFDGVRACKPLTCLQLHDHIVCQCSAAGAQLASGIW